MRFIGNKEAIVEDIYKLLDDKKLLNKNLVFFDAFCGSGAVANHFQSFFKIVINDLLKWATVYTKGRLMKENCSFSKLGLDPFETFSKDKSIRKGFFYNNYSPGNSQRMYFTHENAGRIDFFRFQIEEWFEKSLITDEEYSYLLACLIESISLVANTAGVYGAYLKHWDSRALKEIQFIKLNNEKNSKDAISVFNEKIEEIIEEVECDILYLDPPYTQNQYGTQYHLLETLILNDNPTISKITGSRSTTPLRSDWSKNYKAHILLDKVVAKTKANHIIFSYSTDGIMSKQYIESVLKRYGKVETYICKKIPYKKYRNVKTKRENEHYEYLFYIEKKSEEEVYYESPLNYTGSKFKMLEIIYKNSPKIYSEFIDLFGGGFNVGINAKSKSIIYNDINFFVKDLVESFKKNDTYDYLMYIQKITKKFGLEISNSENYIKARDTYNKVELEKRDPRFLYTIILYGFQQQIRFNNSYNFNNPVGMRWFNDKILEKMISFSRVIKEKEIFFESKDFYKYENNFQADTFVYIDPPYRLTTGSYNDGKRGFNGWTIEDEKNLFEYIDLLENKKIRFMMSYVLEHQGKRNLNVEEWIKKKGYKLIELDPLVGNNRKEVLIVNYE